MYARKYSIMMTVCILCLLAAGITGLFVWQHMHHDVRPDLTELHATLLQKPHAIEPFALTGMDNKPFTNQSLQGRWTLVFFGFSRCGYLCPTTLAELARMYRIFEQEGAEDWPQVVLISLDSERDTPEILKSYVTAFHPRFYAATGEDTQLKKMTHEMGIMYGKVSAAPDNTGDYDIQHSGAVTLFNPKGELVAFFTTPHQAKFLVQDFQLLSSRFKF